jgi:hypothetical protein
MRVNESSLTENLQPGDIVSSKVRTFIWTKHHLKGSKLELYVHIPYLSRFEVNSNVVRWRTRYDALADRALEALPSLASSSSCTSSSPFDLIRHHIHSTSPAERHPDVAAFWIDVTRVPPLSDDEHKGSERAEERRRTSQALVEAGQQVYTTYAAPISLALLVCLSFWHHYQSLTSIIDCI